MSSPISRRSFTILAAGLAASAAGCAQSSRGQPAAEPLTPPAPPPAPAGPVEAAFERDYPPPGFTPGWKKQQINRLLVQDFVIFAHSDLDMVKKLLDREPGLINAMVDWGGGDWETALGGASHMGRRDIVEFLLERKARIDIFCAAMMGQLEAVRAFLTLQPNLIDTRGPHGFTLHFHASVGGTPAEPVLEYLQSIKKVEIKRPPFLGPPANPPVKKPE